MDVAAGGGRGHGLRQECGRETAGPGPVSTSSCSALVESEQDLRSSEFQNPTGVDGLPSGVSLPGGAPSRLPQAHRGPLMPATVRLSENTAGRGCTPHSDPAQIAPFCPGPPRCDPRGACHTPPPTVGLFCFPPAPPSFSSHGRALWASPLGNHCQVLPSPRGLGSHPTPPPARLLFPAALPGGMIWSA